MDKHILNIQMEDALNVKDRKYKKQHKLQISMKQMLIMLNIKEKGSQQ